MVCIVPTPHVGEYTKGVIASALLKGVVRVRGGGGGGESLRQPDKPDEDIVVEILKFMKKESPSEGPVTNTQGDVENVVTESQEMNNNTTTTTTTTIYDDTVND
jgi:hypothetical protein